MSGVPRHGLRVLNGKSTGVDNSNQRGSWPLNEGNEKTNYDHPINIDNSTNSCLHVVHDSNIFFLHQLFQLMIEFMSFSRH